MEFLWPTMLWLLLILPLLLLVYWLAQRRRRSAGASPGVTSTVSASGAPQSGAGTPARARRRSPTPLGDSDCTEASCLSSRTAPGRAPRPNRDVSPSRWVPVRPSTDVSATRPHPTTSTRAFVETQRPSSNTAPVRAPRSKLRRRADGVGGAELRTTVRGRTAAAMPPHHKPPRGPQRPTSGRCTRAGP